MFEIRKGEYRENVESFAIAVLTILFVMIFLVQSFIVDGVSMEPTLHNRNRLIVNKFIFKIRYPKTGDVVVIIPPGDPTRKYIKRVIAGPGQYVKVEAGKVYVNSVELSEPYIKEPPSQDYSEVPVPNETIFVMGDNRNNSTDSRYPTVGFVPLKNVIGKAIFIFWPFPEVKILFDPNYDRTYFSK